jgi:hypothetical protein
MMPSSRRSRPPLVLALFVLALLAAPRANALSAAEPRLVRVTLGEPGPTVEDLLRAGLDVLDTRRGGSALILEHPGDAWRFAALGIVPEVVDETPGRTAARRALAERPELADAARRPQGEVALAAPPVGSGSLGGYWTTAELKMKLDELVAGDASGVVADRIDTVGWSLRGRPVWGLALGRPAAGPDTRPLAFFNSLTHAREPGGMQSLMYFAEDLVSRYGSDPFATYLLDHRRLYIVPLVNPDGYAVNESLYVASGGTAFGFFRKNVRDNNGNGTFQPDSDGVDLNRNFGFAWGYDNVGSSPDPTSEVYRGPTAFSEPESRTQRDLVAALKPTTGLSYHTWGDMMIFPWGYVAQPAQDVSAFREWSDLMSRDNAYQTGEGPNILYPTNGEFNDWCYGDTLLKPRAFTWTPEVGSANDGFWPPPSRILPLVTEMLRAGYVVAAIAGPFVQEDGWEVLEGALNASYGAHLRVRARNHGATGQAGPALSGTLVPLDPGVTMLVPTVAYPALGPRQSAWPSGGASFEMVVHDTVTPGRLLRFRLDFTDAAGLFARDTILVPLGTPTVLASDDASSGTGLWAISSSWGIVSNDPGHPSRYFADSPAGNYGVGANYRMVLRQRLDLSQGVHAYALYEARWDIERDYDACWIEASTDSLTWTRLAATGTTPGSGIAFPQQPADSPVYGGTRWGWQPEVADLSPFTGPGKTQVWIQFRLRSDGAEQYDGFGFDSLRVVLYDPAAQPALVAVDRAVPRAFEFASAGPQPARDRARFEFALPAADNVRLDLLDLQGRRLRTLAGGRLDAGRYARAWDLRDDSGRRVAPGVYFARIAAGAHGVRSQRVIVLP